MQDHPFGPFLREPAVQPEYEASPSRRHGGPDRVGAAAEARLEILVGERARRGQRRQRLGESVCDRRSLEPDRPHRHLAGPDLRLVRRKRGRGAGCLHARRPHRHRGAARLGESQVVGEGDLHLHPLAFVGVREPIGARGGTLDRRLGGAVDPEPRVGEAGVAQPIGIGDIPRRGTQRLADPARPGNPRRAGRRRVGLAQMQRPRRLPRPVEAGAAPAVGRDAALRHQFRIARLAEDVGLAAAMQGERRDLGVGQPAVQLELESPAANQAGPDRVGAPADAEFLVGQPARRPEGGAPFGKSVPVQEPAVHEEHLPHRHGAAPQPDPALREVGQRRADRRRGRPEDGHRRAGQPRDAPGVVDEAHPHLDLSPDVRGHRHIGRLVRADDRLARPVDPDPVVAVLDIGQSVGIVDVARIHAERLVDPARPQNHRRAGRRRVDIHDKHRVTGQRLGEARIVGERHLDLDPLANIRGHHRVGARVRADTGQDLAADPDAVDPEPVVSVAHVVQTVGVGDPARLGGERLPAPRDPRNHQLARRRGVRRVAVVQDGEFAFLVDPGIVPIPHTIRRGEPDGDGLGSLLQGVFRRADSDRVARVSYEQDGFVHRDVVAGCGRGSRGGTKTKKPGDKTGGEVVPQVHGDFFTFAHFGRRTVEPNPIEFDRRAAVGRRAGEIGGVGAVRVLDRAGVVAGGRVGVADLDRLALPDGRENVQVYDRSINSDSVHRKPVAVHLDLEGARRRRIRSIESAVESQRNPRATREDLDGIVALQPRIPNRWNAP